MTIFSFVIYLFSDVKFMGKESFPAFVRAVTILDFSERQKKILIDSVKNNIEALCDTCTFELDALLVSVFEPKELLQYLEMLLEEGRRPVLQRISDLLRYEDFSNNHALERKIETLKQKVSKSLNC